MARLTLLLTATLLSCVSSPRGRDARAPADNRTPEQLTAFLREHERAIAAGERRVLARLDALCGQHDCRASRLFWHTDLEAAKARAQRERKPILSLRMLGKLTDPQSCANSRFFRSVLYADPVIASLLREHFILHWWEVRAVPKVTIEFGDGRTMTRTLTGNSAHYVLDASGAPIDVLPGLFSPRTFAQTLEQDLGLVTKLRDARGERNATLAAWHRARLATLVEQWSKQLRARGLRSPRHADPATALAMLDHTTRSIGYAQLATPAELSPDVVRRISDRFPDAWHANEIAPTKAIIESPVLRGLRQIAETLGRDSIENELWQRGRIHTWFMRDELQHADAVALDQRVYAELFLSPLDDPWYGLMPPEEMRALDDCAVVPRQL